MNIENYLENYKIKINPNKMKKIFGIILFGLSLFSHAQSPTFKYSTTTYHSKVEYWEVVDNRKFQWELTDKKFIQSDSLYNIIMKVKDVEIINGGYIIHVKYNKVKSKFIVKIKDDKVKIQHLWTNKKNRNTYEFLFTN